MPYYMIHLNGDKFLGPQYIFNIKYDSQDLRFPVYEKILVLLILNIFTLNAMA